MCQIRLRMLPFLFALTLLGCGGGGGTTNPPPVAPKFTSVPVATATEDGVYFYQVSATSSDGNAITFKLAAAPTGATLSGSAISWTPTHQQSRIANSFAITATTAAGGTATQTWSVTPNGTVKITAIVSYWTPAGHTDVTVKWLPNVPYPAALIPQTDGSLSRLPGVTNPDGTFSIPNVPAGNYWLQINPNANFWTATSDFDYGEDVIGQPLETAAQSTTTFNYAISGLSPTQTGDFLFIDSDLCSAFPLSLFSLINPTPDPFNISQPVTSNIDWSKMTALYFLHYKLNNSATFSGYTLEASQTLPNVTVTDGAVNSFKATLSPSPTASVPISIKGTTWANMASVSGPGSPVATVSDYAATVQPYLTGKHANAYSGTLVGPPFTYVSPVSVHNSGGLPAIYLPEYLCAFRTGPQGTGFAEIAPPVINTDVDFGTIPYNDPFSADWQRYFQYCQIATVNLPRPNSQTVDTFSAVIKQTTPPPTTAVTPILSPVQNATLNGAGFFQPATLNTTKVTISWNAPATGTPFGYYVSVYQLNTATGLLLAYTPAGRYGTTQTTLTVPFLNADNTYVFTITANMDALATIEKAPLRSQIPSAEAGVVSAPLTIAPGSAFQ